MDGWQVGGWMNGGMDGYTIGRINERMEGHTNEWMDGYTTGRMNVRMDGYTIG